MKNEDTFKDLHLYEDEETIQKTLRYLCSVSRMLPVRPRDLILRSFLKNMTSKNTKVNKPRVIN